MNLSQIELVWVRVRVEWEYFWVNLREDNKVSESPHVQMAESNMAEFKMAAIIKFSNNEWIWVKVKLVWVRVRVEWECFCLNPTCQCINPTWHEFKMATLSKLSQNERVKSFCANGAQECVSEVFFVQMMGQNLSKYGWVWEDELR